MNIQYLVYSITIVISDNDALARSLVAFWIDPNLPYIKKLCEEIFYICRNACSGQDLEADPGILNPEEGYKADFMSTEGWEPESSDQENFS